MCSFEIKKLETLDLIFWAEQRRWWGCGTATNLWQYLAAWSRTIPPARSSQAHLPVLANGGAVPAVTWPRPANHSTAPAATRPVDVALGLDDATRQVFSLTNRYFLKQMIHCLTKNTHSIHHYMKNIWWSVKNISCILCPVGTVAHVTALCGAVWLWWLCAGQAGGGM